MSKNCTFDESLDPLYITLGLLIYVLPCIGAMYFTLRNLIGGDVSHTTRISSWLYCIYVLIFGTIFVCVLIYFSLPNLYETCIIYIGDGTALDVLFGFLIIHGIITFFYYFVVCYGDRDCCAA